MRSLAAAPISRHDRVLGPAHGRTRSPHEQVLRLQRRAGNRAVCQLLARKPPLTKPRFKPLPTTLVGHSSDYERVREKRTFKMFQEDELEVRRIEAGGTGPNEGRAIYSATGARVPDGTYIFVMDVAGNLFIDQHVEHEIYHSSLSAGVWPGAAGEMQIADGLILMVNEASGHYQPAKGVADVVVAELGNQGFQTYKTTNAVRGFVERPGMLPAQRVGQPHTAALAADAFKLRTEQRKPVKVKVTSAPAAAHHPPPFSPRKRDDDDEKGPRRYAGPPLVTTNKFFE